MSPMSMKFRLLLANRPDLISKQLSRTLPIASRMRKYPVADRLPQRWWRQRALTVLLEVSPIEHVHDPPGVPLRFAGPARALQTHADVDRPRVHLPRVDGLRQVLDGEHCVRRGVELPAGFCLGLDEVSRVLDGGHVRALVVARVCGSRVPTQLHPAEPVVL